MKNQGLIEQEIVRRRDMREVFTFTIDPADAKDFDDALSLARNDDGTLQVGVHIADVSFYVRPGSKEDDDAYRRGTSVYLVDRVLPMLPERLCNDLCSLRPGEDKLCMSVVFTMTPEAQVVKHKICRTVIRSDARLNYDEAQAIIEGNFHAAECGFQPGADELLCASIKALDAMARVLREERMKAGALAIEQDEMRFRLDKHGHPTEIYFEQPNEAHHLIEEFMLLANRTVARDVSERKTASGAAPVFVYRVHDKPNLDKLDDLRALKERMGERLSTQAIDMLTIRAQAKAVYSTHNIGHYGLAFSHYTHFTSPIRRYPDLMVHRLVEKYILTGKKDALNREEMEIQCEHCSECEQEAQQAERESVKMFQAMWIADRLGQVFDGHISGVTEFGLFVQLDESRCEGLVHISAIGEKGEYWQYDEKNCRLVCENGKEDGEKSYTLGDPLTVQVVKADVNRRQIDFEIVKK